jgi:hypothetical protein
MISVVMATTAILLKKTNGLREDRFVFTYEYGWSEPMGVGSSKEHESPQLTGVDLRMPLRCSWTDLIIKFPE